MSDMEVKHPAKFNDKILDTIKSIVLNEIVPTCEPPVSILDPFAGVGRIHELRVQDYIHTYAVELEPEWADQAQQLGPTYTGDFFKVSEDRDWGDIDVVATSTTYGNRMADHHEAKDDSRRLTYRHVLGRALSDNNSGMMQWGDEYRMFHRKAWKRVHRLLKPGGWFILNVKDHVRKGAAQGVPQWHRKVIERRFELVDDIEVPVNGMGFGEHQSGTTHKIDHEHVMVFRKPVD